MPRPPWRIKSTIYAHHHHHQQQQLTISSPYTTHPLILAGDADQLNAHSAALAVWSYGLASLPGLLQRNGPASLVGAPSAPGNSGQSASLFAENLILILFLAATACFLPACTATCLCATEGKFFRTPASAVKDKIKALSEEERKRVQGTLSQREVKPPPIPLSPVRMVEVKSAPARWASTVLP